MPEPAPEKPPPPAPPAEPVESPEAAFERRCNLAAWAVLALVLVIGLCTFQRYGVTTDEPIRAQTGENWWKWLQTGDAQYLPDNRLRYYGALFDMICVKASDAWLAAGGADKFTPKHLIIFLTMCLGLLGTYKLAQRMGPQPLPLIALIILALMPRFYGSFNNPKDIPFATAFVWAAYAMVRWVGEPGWKTTLLFAVCAGLATSVRPFGILFLPVGVVVGLCAWFFTRREPVVAGSDEPIKPSIGPWVPAFAAGALGFSYLFWPTLWVSSPLHLPEAIGYLSKFPDGGSSQYFGEVFNREDFAKKSVEIGAGALAVTVPAHVSFIPVWTAITIPAVTLGLMLIGLGLLVWWTIRGQSPGWAWWFAAAWLLTPWIAASIRGSNYSRTGRHFMFLFPAIVLFASLALTAIIQGLRHRREVWIPLALAGVLYGEVVWTMARLFPYESVYFSHIVGGLRGVAGNEGSAKTKFDVENWSQSFAEAFAWLAVHGEGKPVHVHAVAGTDVCRYHAQQHGMAHNTTRPGYFISMYMQGWDERFTGETVHIVERDGVPLTVVKKIVPLDGLVDMTVTAPDGRETELIGWDGRFDLTKAGISVPPMTSYSAEDNAGTQVRLRWRIRSDYAGKLRVYVGFKGPGKVTAGGKDYAVGDRLRFLPFDAFAGMVPLIVDVHIGDNDFAAQAEIRHDPRVYVHWTRFQ